MICLSNNKSKSKKYNKKLEQLKEMKNYLYEENNEVKEEDTDTKIINDNIIDENDNITSFNSYNEEVKEKKIKLNKMIFSNKIVMLILTGLLLITITLVLWFIILVPKIKLNGGSTLSIEVNNNYKEKGYEATYLGKKITNAVKVSGNVNTKKVGIYDITYVVKYKGRSKKVIRKVVVEDKQNPIIELIGSKDTIICPNTKYNEEGYKATDNYDGDITSKVKIDKNENEIIYTVKDTSDNEIKKIRKIIYGDVTNPTIALKGEGTVTIPVGSNYVDSGYSAIDNCDGDITSKVEKIGTVSTNSIGNYQLTYKVKDSYNNEMSVTRTVKVVNPVGNGKVIYLTFDDGPSSITGKMLDIFKQENIKVTFFVTGKVNSYQNILKREAEEGHTIALHTYSHVYSDLYASVGAYFNDLNKIKIAVYNITGKNANIIRFPGGSSNTVSRNYQRGLMSTLVKEVANRGYAYFDWNVSCEDAGGARNANDVYNNVVKNLKYPTNVVLMHDFEGNNKTLNALKNIIDYGKKNGYTFAAITKETPQIHHGVNN